MKCLEDEEVVIRELEGLEVMDTEVKKLSREGAMNVNYDYCQFEY